MPDKPLPNIPSGKILVEFDGYCVLCNRTVRFILKADKKQRFIFRNLPDSPNGNAAETLIVTDGDREYQYFDAVLKIGRELGGFYRAIAVFRIVPRKWRRQLYLWVARNRFRWFWHRASCYLPSDEEKGRFF